MKREILEAQYRYHDGHCTSLRLNQKDDGSWTVTIGNIMGGACVDISADEAMKLATAVIATGN